MSEIVADRAPFPVIGARYLGDWDRLDREGRVVTHRNIPYVVLREVTYAVYCAAHPNAPVFSSDQLRTIRFFEVSVD
jgi:hypothetical protein